MSEKIYPSLKHHPDGLDIRLKEKIVFIFQFKM